MKNKKSKTTEEKNRLSAIENDLNKSSSFFGEGVFECQLTPDDPRATWQHRCFNEQKWWGQFPRDIHVPADMFAEFQWAIGPFTKHHSNPILAPTAAAWDRGHIAGGVHNGSIVRHKDRFYYIYRGEKPIDIPTNSQMNYICDIGVAVSEDGTNFVKDTSSSPFFRRGHNRRYSYEDPCVVRYDGTYYLFCNQWLWDDVYNPQECGVFAATSKDLKSWHKHGLLFPKASRIHRNPVIIQNSNNDAERINGKFIMYINGGLMAYSDDLLNWQSCEIDHCWPDGEGCFALTSHDPKRPRDIVLFTGGHHTGHFYAIGEVLFSADAPQKPIEWLPSPVLFAEKKFPYEDGFSAEPPHSFISCWADTIFFTGMTMHKNQWLLYYGGSEYYTCLATAPANNNIC